MSEFTPIETQEQLDSVIGERLSRERKKMSEKYADYDSLKESVGTFETQLSEKNAEIEGLKGQIAGFQKDITDRDQKIAKYEADSAKTRIATEFGLPLEFATRLQGASEEEFREDADRLSRMIGNQHYTAPLGSTEQKKDAKEEAFRKLASNVNGGN